MSASEHPLVTARRQMHLDPPRCVPAPGNSAQQPNPLLLTMARDERLYNAGLSEQAFIATNIATAKFLVSGRSEYIAAGNLPQNWTPPGAARRESAGLHSEQYLLAQFDYLRARARGQGGAFLVELYSERIPCFDLCMPLVKHHFPAADIFYSVRSYSRELGSKAQQLMRAYGL